MSPMDPPVAEWRIPAKVTLGVVPVTKDVMIRHGGQEIVLKTGAGAPTEAGGTRRTGHGRRGLTGIAVMHLRGRAIRRGPRAVIETVEYETVEVFIEDKIQIGLCHHDLHRQQVLIVMGTCQVGKFHR